MIQELKKLKCGKILEDVPFAKLTSYKLKGTAKLVIYPESIDSLIKIITFCKNKSYSYKVVGGCSNLIFEKEIYDGVLIKLDSFNTVKISGTSIFVGAGYSLMKLAIKTCRLGLTGLEFACGIPGTIGGSIFNNSGAYKSDMGYIVKKITVLTPEFKVKEMTNQELGFHYRTSFLKDHPDYICLDATIQLQYGKKEDILEIVQDRKQRRLESQPLEYPSAGSVFRNPPGLFVGKLIEDMGYKGKRFGDAMISLKHANFIINVGNATGNDIVTLIEQTKEKVKETYDVELILEQEIVR